MLLVLQKQPYQIFSNDGMQDPLILFQRHFILFNALYQLKDRWHQEQSACLDIVVTHIRYLPFIAGQEGLIQADNLRAYYLDWQNFTDTKKEDVEELIESFWQLMDGEHSSSTLSQTSIENAFKCLLIKDSDDFKQVKIQYRKLLHQHHPDKGGDTQKSQEIKAAYAILKAYFNNH
ncbi:DNA-J related domain-containing protein [Thalassotalea sp. SU-HH00458]